MQANHHPRPSMRSEMWRMAAPFGVFALVMSAVLLPVPNGLADVMLWLGRYSAVALLVAFSVGWVRRYTRYRTDAYAGIGMGKRTATVARIGTGIGIAGFVFIGLTPFTELARPAQLTAVTAIMAAATVTTGLLLVTLMRPDPL